MVIIKGIEYVVVLLFLFLEKISLGQTTAVAPRLQHSGSLTNGSSNLPIIDSLEQLLNIMEHELFIRFFMNFFTSEKIFQPNEQL